VPNRAQVESRGAERRHVATEVVELAALAAIDASITGTPSDHLCVESGTNRLHAGDVLGASIALAAMCVLERRAEGDAGLSAQR
jgi:hypothetical protein